MDDRTPPNDQDAEQALLGHILNLGRIPHGVNGLAPSDFYQPVHEFIFAAMRSLTDQGERCDIYAVKDYLEKRDEINSRALTPIDLFELTQTRAPIDPAYVANIIQQNSQRRQLIRLHEGGLQHAYESADDVETQLQRTQEALGRIHGHSHEGKTERRFTPGGNFILDTEPTPQALWGEGEHVIWPDGEALIIAGTQGLGKTTLAGQLALGRGGFPEYSDLLGYPIKPGLRRVLYLAMDRPKQAARSFRRMVGEEWRQILDEVLMVWQGPPAHDLGKYPSLLLKLCQDADADTVIVDSLKDAAIGLSDDEVGAGYNRARQTALAAGIQIAELHHPRKDKENKRTEIILDDLYGSTWLTAGAGSVIGLIGKPGDPIVKLHHLKQPATAIGPFTVLHDDKTGRSTIWHAVDLVELVQARGTISAVDVARALYDTDKPTPSEKENVRRKLDRLVNSGHLWVVDPGDQKTNRPKTWAAK